MGMSEASPTSATIRTSASTNTARQQAPDQVTGLQQDLFGLQPRGLATCVTQTNITPNENSLGGCYLHPLPPLHTIAPLSTKNHLATLQNHRTFGVGRDLCGSSSPNPLPKQGHLQQAAQDLVQAGIEYLQRRLHNLPGLWAPWPCSRAPSPSEGSSSSCSDGTSSASVCARCPLSCHWAPLKGAWPHPPDTHPSDIYKHL